jgi:ribosomal protein S18 acetylase RimI-like enzyme
LIGKSFRFLLDCAVLMMRKGRKPVIRVRKARVSDREAVFRFCRRTWTWGDYVPKVWNRWLKDKNGQLFTATIDGVPVGISYVSMDKPREAWLRGARTDPKYRRMGIATAITKKCLEYAKLRGAKIARLATESDNVAAQALLKKLGLKPIAEFFDADKENIAGKSSKNSGWAETVETDSIWSFLRSSELYRKAAELYTIIFQYFSLEKCDLKRFIEQRKAIVHRNDGQGVDGLVLVDDAVAREWREKVIQTCYVDGDVEVVIDMMKFLMCHCETVGIRRIRVFAPNDKQTTAAFEKLGFKVSDSLDIIYAKKI